MNIVKTSEKVLVWMHRNKITQQTLATELNTTRQTVAKKLSDNIFTIEDIMNLKRLGFTE